MFRRQRSWCWLAFGLLGTVLSSGGVAAQDAASRVDLYGDALPAGAIARLGTIRYRHGGWQRSFLFAPDHKTLLSATDGGSLCWFNAADGKLIRRLDVEDRPFGTIVFAPGGRIVASAGRQRWTDKGAGPGIIRLSDFDTGKTIRTIPYGDKVEPKFLFFTPDGKTLLTAGERYESDIRIFDVASGDELLTYKLSSKGVGAMALTPDGNLVAVAEEHGDSIYLWEWQTPNKPRRLASKLERGVNFLAFSPDGRMLISSGDDRRGLCFWDVATGSLLNAEIVGDSSCSVRRAAFSNDGRLLATAVNYYESRPETTYSSSKSGVFLWSPPTLFSDRAKEEKRRPAKLLRKIPARALDLAISSDGKTLNLLTEAGPSRWDIETGKELTPPFVLPDDIDHVSFAASGKVVTVGAAATRFWDAKTGKQLNSIPITRWTSAVLSPDGTHVATAAHDNTVRLFNAGSGQQIFRLPGHGELGPRYSVAFSSDGKRFSTFGEDKYLRVWSTANGRALQEHLIRPASLELPDEDDQSKEANMKRRMLEFKMMQAYFSPEAGSLIVSVQGKVHVYDVGMGKERVKFDAEDGHNVAVSPDSRWLLMSAWGRVAIGKDGKAIQPKNDVIVVYALANGKEKLRMQIPRSSAGAVAFAADGGRFALAVHDKASQIDVHDITGKKLQSISGFTGKIRHLAFSNENLLACALDDGTVLIWDLQKVAAYKGD